MTITWTEVSDGIYKGKCNGRHVATVLRFARSATWALATMRAGARAASVEGAKRAAEEAYTQQEVRLEP